MELNSLGDDVLKLLASDGSGIVSSTVASSEYKLRATVCVFLRGTNIGLYIFTLLLKFNICVINAVNIYITGVKGASWGSSDMYGNGQGM